MGKLVEIAVYDTAFDVKFNMLKDMLDEAGIPFLVTNEKMRTLKPLASMGPSNVGIGLKVDEENLEEAMKILKSIE